MRRKCLPRCSSSEKKNGTDFHQCRSRPRILRVLAVLPRLLQCRRLVNIFEMMPPVQRMQTSRSFFYRNPLPPSSQFRIPWTGGNPKLYDAPRHVSPFVQFRIPWTGGNPKLPCKNSCFAHQFRIPWTGGNPKHSGTFVDNPIEFRIPWTGGNPKRFTAHGNFVIQFRIPWTGAIPNQP